MRGPVGDSTLCLYFIFSELSIVSVHTPIYKEGIYFITFTCHRWLPLIDISDGYSSVYRFFEVLKNKGHKIAAYVIMPNHVHLLLDYNSKEKSLNSLIGNGKRFMAYDIIKKMQQKGEHSLLKQLQNEVQYKDREKRQKHVVWKDGFDVKECRTEKFVLQKLF